MQAKYSRILLKISGEALSGNKGPGFDTEALSGVAQQIADVVKLGVSVGIVVGGGNFWRGRQGDEMDRTTADYMGMMATVIKAPRAIFRQEYKAVQITDKTRRIRFGFHSCLETFLRSLF